MKERHDGVKALRVQRKPMEEESFVSPAETLERGSVPSREEDLEVECGKPKGGSVQRQGGKQAL